MSDDLVTLLRRPYGNLTGGERQAVADRIESLEAKLREAALSELSALGQASEAHTAQLDAEAKLAQAVEAIAILEDALQEAGDDYPGSKMQEWCQQQVKRARATIAAIKGEAE